jgi:polyhydroxyalkanoate synthesis regulator phasin
MGKDAKPGESCRDHIRRLTRWYGPYQSVPGLGEYVFRLEDRVDALERRVAELEARSS